jgi:hypothetical protein
MNKQRIGQILYWLGVVGLFINYFVTWIRRPIYAANTAAELSGTFWDPKGAVFAIVGLSLSLGLGCSIIRALLYSGKKGSRFWLWGLVPLIALFFLTSWSPSQHLPPLYGIGGGIITIAYLGSLYTWIKAHAAYEGRAKTGKQMQLLGYSFLYMTAIFLCVHLGTPHLPALAGIQIPSAESILVSLSVGILLLFVGDYAIARSLREATPRPQAGKK